MLEVTTKAIQLNDLSLPVAAATELSKLAVFLGYCCSRIYETQKDENDVPPPTLLPWIREYRASLHEVAALLSTTPPGGENNVKVFIEVYKAIQDQLPEAARREVARAASKLKGEGEPCPSS